MTVDDFLRSLHKDVYPEVDSQQHTAIPPAVWKQIKDRVPSIESCLDIGFGCGHFMRLLRGAGAGHVQGITMCAAEAQRMRAEGFHVQVMDMHQLRRLCGPEDFIVARHVLEHSPIPLYVLVSIREIMRETGRMYIEVPLPETTALHELANKNHYSVFTPSAWEGLFGKAGFEVEARFQFPFEAQCGPDIYFGWLLTKKPIIDLGGGTAAGI